jgi:hypothetical protein
VEAWTEVNLAPVRVLDKTLLELVDALVHEKFGEQVATWFFFWEPELRLRIRWREPGQAADHRAALAVVLDSWKARHQITDWYEGAHGERGRTYVGEAENYGEEVWSRLQEDWMNGSELALTLVRLDRAKRLPHALEYYWQRRVHLFTNQLLGTCEAEIEQCLRQALGYLRLRGSSTPQAKKLLGELKDFR